MLPDFAEKSGKNIHYHLSRNYCVCYKCSFCYQLSTGL